MADTTAAEPKIEEGQSPLIALVDKVAGTPMPQEGKPSSGAFLPIALILLGVVVVGFAVLGIALVMARRKAAKLAAQVRKLEEQKAQSLEAAELAKSHKERHAAMIRTGEFQSRIDVLEGRLLAMAEQNKARTAELAKVSSWDDIVIVDRRNP